MFEKVVWLTGMPRSGTNWASQIFASHPDVRVKFCPLFSYAFKDACDENSSVEEWQDLFRKVYSTQDEYLDQEYLRKDGLVPAFSEKEQKPLILCIKSTRYHHLIPRLVEMLPNFQVVALIRNPAASIHSWLTNPHEFPADADPASEWRTGHCRKTGSGEFWGFDDWKSVTRQQLRLARNFPDRVKTVVYEDLVRDAAGETEEVFEWLGLRPHPQTNAFLAESQSTHRSHKRAVFKEPSAAERWMNEIDPGIRYTIGRELVGSALARFCDDRTLAVGAGWTGPKASPAEVTAKATVDDLAALGGTPLFQKTSPRPIGQLAKPSWPVFSSYVDSIYETHRISNNGNLVQTLERRLARYHDVEHCVAYANATLAIIALLHSVARPGGREIILPAFTYVGLPHIVKWAGYEPCFGDIDVTRQTLAPASVECLLGDETAAILAVHQVNAPCDYEAFQKLSERTGVPVVYDSVHALGCTLPNGMPVGRLGEAEVFSLHATKILNGFEGGYITTDNGKLAAELRSLRNFGYTSDISTDALGFNGKLNEIHSAMALASFEEIDSIVMGNQARYAKYHDAFRDIEGLSFVEYQDSYNEKNFEFALLRVEKPWPFGRDETVALLRAENALARAYYNEPLFRDDNYPKPNSGSKPNLPRDVSMPLLPTTTALAKQIIQMPVGGHVSLDDIQAMAEWFRFIQANSENIIPRIRQPGEPVW